MTAQPKLRIWISLVFLAGVSSAAAADDLYVACHADVSLAAADIRDVFVGEKQFSKATKLVPVDNVAAQATFLEKVLRMSASKYANTWAKKSFRDGVHPPVVKANDAEMLEFIKRTPGGCGYLVTAPRLGVTVIGKY